MIARLLAVTATVLVLTGAPASAAAELEIISTETGDPSAVQLVVRSPDLLVGRDMPAEAVRVEEDGAIIQPTSVEPLPGDELEVVLVVDTSGSMAGEPIAAARDAAAAFVDSMPSGSHLAVVGFSSAPAVLSPMGSPEAAREAVTSIVASGETALYDAVIVGLEQFGASDSGNRALVVLSDGGDTVSAAGLDEARERLGAAGVDVHVVELISSEADHAALERLASAAGGEVVPVADSAGLARVYDRIAADLTSRFVVTYATAATGTVDVRIALNWEDVAAVSPRHVLELPGGVETAPTGEVRSGELRTQVVAAPGLFANPWVRWAGAGAFFLGASVLLGVTLGAGERRLRATSRSGGGLAATTQHRTSDVISSMRSRLGALADGQLRRQGRFEQLNRALERSGSDLRPGEFIVAVVAFSAAGGLLVTMAVGQPATGIVLMVAGPIVAKLYLSLRTSRRRARFADDLSDTLQLMSGSLRAGYGLLQAVDAVAGEAEPPVSEEFHRVIVETRLGRDLNEALDAMAERVGSEDLEWVVQAIRIQREVGGDLAEILDTVAETIRERNQIRRQVKALSAEGRLSAVVLLLLPFGVGGMIAMTNPSYLAELFTSLPGLIMLTVGVVLMSIGALWLKRIVRFEF